MTREVHPGPSFFLRPTVTYLHPYAQDITREGGFCQPFWVVSVQIYGKLKRYRTGVEIGFSQSYYEGKV
jgi:hypothetical protein